MITVLSWGIGGSVVSGGRHGRAWLGQSRGGAVDLASYALANRLVGNVSAAGCFETSGGFALEVDAPTMVAMTGALAPVTIERGPPLGWGNPVVLPPGARLRLGRLADGARVYIGIRGGVDSVGATVGADPGTAAAEQPAARHAPNFSIRIWPGPRAHWFHPDAWLQLLSAEYVVADTSRIGARLVGPSLQRARVDELPSEGLVEGAVQVPPDGQPIIMLADHPTTGGYPVIAVVDAADLPAVAQAAPGTSLRFVDATRRQSPPVLV